MSKPVKVSKAFYEQLRDEAEQSGMTIRQALESRLERAKAEAERLGALASARAAELRVAEEKLRKASRDGRSSALSIDRLRSEVAAMRSQLGELESERSELSELVDGRTRHAEELSRTHAADKATWEAREESYRGWLILLGLAALVLGLVAVARWMPMLEAREGEPTEGDRETLLAWGA